MKPEDLKQILGNSVPYYPKLAKVTGGVSASTFLCQILRWQFLLEKPYQWVRKTDDEIESVTGLSLLEQELARKQLIKRSLLKERAIKGEVETLEFWIDIEVLEKRLNGKLKQENASPTSNTVEVIENSTHKLKSDSYFPSRRQPIAVTVTPNYQFSGPWESTEQFEAFQKALLEYAKEQGLNNPSGWVFKIVDGITKGLVSPFWDEFISGVALGSTQQVKREWEVKAGVPYPAFEEERIQYYVQKGEPLEVAVSKARMDLRNPVLGKDLWEGFLRKCDRLADDAIKAKKLGVKTSYLPPSFTNKPQITKQSVINKLSAIASESSTPELSENKDVKDKNFQSINAPPISVLQKAYDTKMGRSLIEKQINQHPEWGYKIVNGKIVDLFPF